MFSNHDENVRQYNGVPVTTTGRNLQHPLNDLNRILKWTKRALVVNLSKMGVQQATPVQAHVFNPARIGGCGAEPRECCMHEEEAGGEGGDVLGRGRRGASEVGPGGCGAAAAWPWEVVRGRMVLTEGRVGWVGQSKAAVEARPGWFGLHAQAARERVPCGAARGGFRRGGGGTPRLGRWCAGRGAVLPWLVRTYTMSHWWRSEYAGQSVPWPPLSCRRSPPQLSYLPTRPPSPPPAGCRAQGVTCCAAP